MATPVSAPERTERRPWAHALGLYGAVLVVVTTAVVIGAAGPLAYAEKHDVSNYPMSWLFGGWFRYDGRWYDIIATDGYSFHGTSQQSAVAYFPGYPLLLRILHSITTVDVRLLGTLVTIAFGAGVAVLFHRWCREHATPIVARYALVTYLLYPYAFYLFGAVYADALFLFATIGAFLLLEHDHPVLAGLAGAVASATRPLGIAVIIGLVAVMLWRRHAVSRDGRRMRFAWRSLRPSDGGVLLSVAGLVAYMIYLGVRFGHPLAFDEVQRAQGWDQGSGPRTWFKITWFQQAKNLPGWVVEWLAHGRPDSFEKVMYAVTVLLQGALVLAFVAIAVIVWRRLGWGYGLFCLSALAIALVGTKDFQGTGRYLLTTFPCFLVLGTVLADRPRWRWAVWIVSGTLLLAWSLAFGRGYYVA